MKTIATTVSLPPIEPPTLGKKIGKPRKKTLPKRGTVKFRLYVADHSPNSVLARANLAALCAQHFPDQHEIEIVDVFREPERARDDGIIMTPALVKIAPLPVRKIVGSLGHAEVGIGGIGSGDVRRENSDREPAEDDMQTMTAAPIRTLLQAGQRLEELTQGEIDAVTDSHGRTVLLPRAQAHLLENETVRQRAILNSLPANAPERGAATEFARDCPSPRRFHPG